jgi:hypothetical protein
VAVQGVLGLLDGHVVLGGGTIRDVLAQRIAGASVDEQYVIDDATLREGAEPGAGRVRDGVSRPFRRRARLGVEPIDLGSPDRCCIVIAAHARRVAFVEAGHHGVRLRTIADHIAEVPDGIDIAGVGEDRVEGHDVAMDIG